MHCLIIFLRNMKNSTKIMNGTKGLSCRNSYSVNVGIEKQTSAQLVKRQRIEMTLKIQYQFPMLLAP